MNIFFLPIVAVIVTTTIATYFDIKKGIIPNKIPISLLLFGIAINSIFSLLYNDSSYIFTSIILTIFTFILTYILWKFKIWAGGDVKLLTAIASAIPTQPNLIDFQFFNIYFPKIAIYPFPLTVIFNSILISFPFLILFLVLTNYKISNSKKNNYKIDFKQNFPSFKRIIKFFKYILMKFNSKKRVIFKKIAYSLIFSTVFIIITGIYENSYYSIYILFFGVIFSLISSFLFKSWIKTFKNFVKNISSEKIPIFSLDEGMIIDKTYFKVDKFYSSIFEELINNLDTDESNLSIKKIANEKSENEQIQYFLNSSTAAGLTIYDISFLKKLFKMKFIPENIQIKIGIPFAPSIAIGLIIAIFIGDLCLLLIDILNNILIYSALVNNFLNLIIHIV